MPTPRLHASALLSTALLLACSPRPNATEFLTARVTWEAGVTATCFVVTATSTLPSGGEETRRTEPMARPTSKDSLLVAIGRDGRGDTATLQALGYADATCTQATGERSDRVELSFGAALGREPEPLLVRVAPPNLDVDGDGVPTPDDCDDGDATIAPGKAELCGDQRDNDCDGDADCADQDCADQACAAGATCRATRCAETACDDGVDNDGDTPRDCADGDCAGQACGLGGTCMSGQCRGATEVLCTDGVDNDGDLQVDCGDPDCASRACDDGTGCTTGETCSGGVCGGGTPKDCATGVPACFVSAGCDAGVCLATPGPVGSACDDGDACTGSDGCDGDGGCRGSAVSCGAPPGPCFGAGSCSAALDGGCTWPVVTTNACSDGDGCTVGDACQADGGCAGTRLDCSTPPGECFAWASTCTAGVCDFTPRSGACDGGSCSGGACVPASTVTWPYAPSNFLPATLPADAGPALAVSCTAAVLDTGGPGGPTFTPTGCSAGSSATLPMTVVTQPSGGEAVLVTGAGFVLDAGTTLRVVGARPVIFAIRGDVTLAGQLLAAANGGRPGAGADPAAGCIGATGFNGLPDVSETANGGAGAGGGAFGSAGGRGGSSGGTSGTPGDGGVPVGNAALVPLRGGCSGGRGGYSATGSVFGAAGLAGGAVQVSATGALVVRGTIGAPGGGGGGGPGDTAGGGGGGSGGAILLEATSLQCTPTARVLALGGGGGEGAGDDPGNTGAAGSAGSLTTDTPAPGGAGSSSRGGDGAAGASSTIAAGNGAAGVVNVGPGGGGAGGGGVGRVRFNVTGACTFESGAVVAPVQSTPDGGCR